MKTCLALGAACMVLVGSVAGAEIRHVPSSYATIQSAILAAMEGDTVLIAPGRYAENINFLGKNIVVGSNFLLTGDRSFIRSTVIDGGSPVHPDTASCVLIVGGEDSTAVLEGLTLTRGRGTRWMDEHGAGVFREGGGILITLSSPTIRNTIIVDNEAINSAGSVSAGGGAIRVGDGAPHITGNIITGNRGMYGGGIVLNYCSGAVIRNNIISQNDVYQAVPGVATFGGGGIWLLLRIPGNTTPNVLENNTIVGNNASGDGSGSAGRGGGVVFQNADITARNNIIWGNTQDRGGQIDGPLPLTYSVVEGGFTGIGNTGLDPLFADTAYQVIAGSPAVDGGDPSPVFNDIESPVQPGQALWPSQGTIRNDVGAYGGPIAKPLSGYWRAGFSLPVTSVDFGLGLPGGSLSRALSVRNRGSRLLGIDSVRVLVHGERISATNVFPMILRPGALDSLHLMWNPDSAMLLEDTLLIFHDDTATISPARVRLVGNSIPTPLLFVNTAEFNFYAVDVNVPRRDSTFFVYNRGTAADSVDVSLVYNTVHPPEALSVAPASFLVAAGDSQEVTFTFFPPVIVRVGLGLYSPAVVVNSLRGTGTTRFQKTMRFRIIGTLDVEEGGDVPGGYVLAQNYPNPFNGETKIGFQVSGTGAGEWVTLKVYDVLGREVSTLVNGPVAPGFHAQRFDAHGLSSGTYVYRLTAGGRAFNRRMILVQ